jgi:hypothetical protein
LKPHDANEKRIFWVNSDITPRYHRYRVDGEATAIATNIAWGGVSPVFANERKAAIKSEYTSINCA